MNNGLTELCKILLPTASARTALISTAYKFVQVVAMANKLVDEAGLPLLHTVRVSSNQPPPRQLPDITIATPAGLIYASDNYGHHYGSAWTKEGLVGR